MSTEEQTVSQNQLEVTTPCILKVVMNNGEEVYITLSEEQVRPNTLELNIHIKCPEDVVVVFSQQNTYQD